VFYNEEDKEQVKASRHLGVSNKTNVRGMEAGECPENVVTGSLKAKAIVGTESKSKR